MKVEFFKHNLNEQDIQNAVNVLHSTFLTTGKVVDEFEKKFAEFIGVKHAIGVSSCTGALHLSLLAYNIGKGDEVITTPMTFIATPNSIIMAGAKPVFVDVDKETGNIDLNLIPQAITPKTKAIMPVHLYGQMVDMIRLQNLADYHNLTIIDDAAHALEARNKVRVGKLLDTTCYSFYATKAITSGEGGAITTNNDYIDIILRKLRNSGMSKNASERYNGHYEHWDMEMMGWKYNMSNIQASLLINQIDRIDEYWQRRDKIAKYYEQEFDKIGIEHPIVLPNSKSGRHLFTIWVDTEKRDDILHKLQDKGIGVAVNYRAIHLLKYYRETFGYKRGDFPVAESIGDRTISLPLYPKLTDLEVEYVVKCVKEVAC